MKEERGNTNVASIGSVATLPENGLIWPQLGRVRFACWDNPKPLCRTEPATAEIMRM